MIRATAAEIASMRRNASERVEAGWCQEASARAGDGTPCDVLSPDAASFCAVGALRIEAIRFTERTIGLPPARFSPEQWRGVDELAWSLHRAVERDLGAEGADGLDRWNDDLPARDKDKVVAALRGSA